MRNLDELVLQIKKTVEKHNLGKPGQYQRWLWESAEKPRQLGLNEYGVADAANILYQIGYFPQDPKERAEWVSVLQGMQNPETGMYAESTHHTMHTTAHCMAALELFDAKPLYRPTEVLKYKDKNELYKLLDSLRWEDAPWRDSHIGAGIYVVMLLSDEADIEWIRAYFKWLDDNADPITGMWRKGFTTLPESLTHKVLGGAFHYLFNMENHKRAIIYPEKMIDTCLEQYLSGELNHYFKNFGRRCEFLEMDFVYCITRAMRQCHHRFEECRQTLLKFEKEFLDFMLSCDYEKDESFNDMHSLFAATCTLAELSSALPGTIETTKPLKLVLDRRPFI